MRAPLPEMRKSAAIDGLFQDLLEAIEARVARAGSGTDPSRRPDAAGALRVSKPRALSEGVAFVLEGHGGSFRFTNSLKGFILVTHEERAASREESIISVHRRGMSYRPIVKALFPRVEGRGLMARYPTPFAYTSVPVLPQEYLLRAEGQTESP